MRADDTVQPTRPTFSDILRKRFGGYLEPAARLLIRLGIAPNTVTLAGLLGNFVGAMLLARGYFLAGGLLVLFMGPLDALDGAMARLRGEPSDFGGFVDSVTDRYSELLIYGGLLIFYLSQLDLVTSGLVFAAASGSVMVSYVRARAEALGFEAKRGLLTRAERFVVLAPSLIFNYPKIGLALIATLANLTALQRIYFVRKQAYSR